MILERIYTYLSPRRRLSRDITFITFFKYFHRINRDLIT
jgi:hypothetical protein